MLATNIRDNHDKILTFTVMLLIICLDIFIIITEKRTISDTKNYLKNIISLRNTKRL